MSIKGHAGIVAVIRIHLTCRFAAPTGAVALAVGRSNGSPEKIETRAPAGKLVFHVFAALAEFERNLIRERTGAGLKVARARGRKGGRPAKLSAKEIKTIRALPKPPTSRLPK